MFRNKDTELLEHRIAQLEKEIEGLNGKYARKLVETIVFGAVGAILFGFMTSMVGGNTLLSLLGGS